MKNQDLFKKDIKRDIQGVVTIGNEEEFRKQQELEEREYEVKTGGGSTTGMLVTFLVIVAAVLAVLVGYSIWKRRRKARRGKYYQAK